MKTLEELISKNIFEYNEIFKLRIKKHIALLGNDSEVVNALKIEQHYIQNILEDCEIYVKIYKIIDYIGYNYSLSKIRIILAENNMDFNKTIQYFKDHPKKIGI